MSLLITGQSGFVGSHLQKQTGCAGLVNSSGNLVDLLDPEAVSASIALHRPDAVIHLAAQTFVPDSVANPRMTYDANFIGTHNLLAALKAQKFSGRLLFVSSADVYGILDEKRLPATEETALNPLNPYAVSKIAAETLCRYWFLAEGLDVIIARPFNHIGPGQSARFALADFSRTIAEISLGLRDNTIQVGDLETTRDFTDFRDVIDAYLLLLNHGRAGEIYNVCSGVERNLKLAVQELAQLAGTEVSLVTDPSRMRKASQRRAVGSAEKLRSDTGWLPTTPWLKSLQDMFDYWKQALK